MLRREAVRLICNLCSDDGLQQVDQDTSVSSRDETGKVVVTLGYKGKKAVAELDERGLSLCIDDFSRMYVEPMVRVLAPRLPDL